MKKIKKIALLILLFINSIFLDAQSYIGLLTENYSGVNSVIANPANIVDSRFKTDINLVGFSVFGGNDYYGVNILDAIKEDYDFDLDAKKSPSASNNLGLNVDVMGPSFMFNINKNNAIAIFTRARAFVNVNDINGTSVDVLDNDDTNNDYSISEGDFSAFGHAWAELGITYARVLLNDNQHFLKGGLSLKYLQGGGSAYVNGKNLTVDYDEDGIIIPGGTTGSVTSTGEVTYGRYEDFDDDDYDYELPKSATGFGADLGFVYEWRPNYADYKATNSKGNSYSYKDKNKYKLKLGLSITDLGSVKYKDGIEESFDVNRINVSEDDINNQDDLNDKLNNIYTISDLEKGFTAKLPTALHLNADWSFNRRFYLNLNTDLSLISKSKTNANRVSNVVSLTPRFESKWFSFYTPISVVQNNGFQVGAGLRAGPLYVGSGSVLTALTGDNSKGADVYAGLKIPVYQGKPRDRDEDGVIDKLDDCPKVPGPIENNGCPWGDKDRDSILDNVDACPEEAGPKENNGCPWGDKDGDSILDNVDACPEIAGPKENNGCPWKDTDSDGVLDKDDKCVNEVGTVANNGCPEIVEPVVTQEIQKTLNSYAKTILFNSGKSSIKEESNAVLIEIVKILQEYPNAKFSIEGHTDSAGSNSLNQKLSDSRANSVRNFLIDNGIDQNRLTAVGYGESNPIANNATRAGRAQNRRVEINLVK